MNFDYSEDQLLLRDQASKLLEADCPPDRVRAILADPDRSWDEPLWRQVAGLGWLGLAIPESDGGIGLDPVNLCAVAEQLGRAVAPLPFASSIYQVAEALTLFGSADQRLRLLPALIDGSAIGCMAVAEGPGAPRTPATVIDGDRLSGVKLPVVDGGIATHAIVLASDGAGTSLALVDLADPGVARRAVATLDPSRDAARVEFDGVRFEGVGEAGQGVSLLERIQDRAAVFIAFEQVGGAQKAMEYARDYALQRYAFGRLIGSYQAIKHKLADMFVRIELARSHAYFGAWALKGDNPALPRAAAAARVAASDAYWFAAKECVEIFGGIGTTLETDCHLHYRRSKQLALTLGGPAPWRERLVASLEHDNHRKVA